MDARHRRGRATRCRVEVGVTALPQSVIEDEDTLLLGLGSWAWYWGLGFGAWGLATELIVTTVTDVSCNILNRYYRYGQATAAAA